MTRPATKNPRSDGFKDGSDGTRTGELGGFARLRPDRTSFLSSLSTAAPKFLSHLPVMRSEVAFAGARRARSAFRSRPSGPRVMHSRRRALWVSVDAPHEVFALCGPRAARPGDCRSMHSKNALNPARVAVSSRARPDSPLPQVSGAEAAPAPDTPFLTCTPTCSASLRSQWPNDPACPPRVEADGAQEPNESTPTHARSSRTPGARRRSSAPAARA
jgi:hypothetical protein